MPVFAVRYLYPTVLAACVLWPCAAAAWRVASGQGAANSQNVVAAADLAQRAAEYRRKLKAYTIARAAFEAKAAAYWEAIAEKRRGRFAKRRKGEAIVIADYVLVQPPRYAGPSRPVDPAAPTPEIPRRQLPVAADFLAAAMEHFAFVPQRAAREIDFKRAYARVAAEAGLTRTQAVRVYGFEAGGNGTHDVQAGLEHARPGARAISTALGYNQLLVANSIDILADDGDAFVRKLTARAATLGDARPALEAKIAVLRRMIAFSRSVPYAWSAHVKLGETPKGMALHALNLDIDIGPLLQTQKLLDSVVFARRKGHAAPLSAAELEMMNLTGDGNGFDMVTMPQAMRAAVPTANFFQRGGYERNPVAIKNNTVATLITATDARMDREERLPGARELAAGF
ncbi:MAG: hypothetical protein HY056_18145 [Proteobacteria bacterium]|nr:hypothetical protein [Pseudomonadota bacterium]